MLRFCASGVQDHVLALGILHMDRELDFGRVSADELKVELDPRIVLPVRLVGEHAEDRTGRHDRRLGRPAPSAGRCNLVGLHLRTEIGSGRAGRGLGQRKTYITVCRNADVVGRP